MNNETNVVGCGALFSSPSSGAERRAIIYLRLAHEAEHDDARETFLKYALDEIALTYNV